MERNVERNVGREDENVFLSILSSPTCSAMSMSSSSTCVCLYLRHCIIFRSFSYLDYSNLHHHICILCINQERFQHTKELEQATEV